MIWRHPDGPRGTYNHGFRRVFDNAADWDGFSGLRMEVRVDGGQPAELTATVLPPDRRDAAVTGIAARVQLAGTGGGWQTVTLPWTSFEVPTARSAWLMSVRELRLAARFPEGAAGSVSVRSVRPVRGAAVFLAGEVRGRSVAPGGTAEYVVTLGNETDRPQAVALGFVRYGWEAMEATVDPANVLLQPGETRPVTVRVRVPGRVPPGGHERQVLQAVANGDAATAATLTFTTAGAVPAPSVLLTADRWREVRDKVKTFPWAKGAQDDFVQKAAKWQVPDIARPPKNDPDDNLGPFLFPTSVEQDVMACGVAWQLTREKAHAEKIAEFLRRLSNPGDGYPKTFRACNQGFVQEGHFFQHIAMAYDMIGDAGVLSDADRRQIEATLRLVLETIDRGNRNGPINNWNLSEVTGALYCALTLGDLAAAERFFAGPSGVKDQLAKGTMDDGWWNECAISYNVWCASEFTQVALALQPWGYSFQDERVPASYSPFVALTTEISGGRTGDAKPGERPRPFGMTDEVYGPNHRPFRAITDLWNSLLPFLDYRGVMFGVNDSAENKVSGSRAEVGGAPFELAYYVYRVPAYASVIQRGDGKRDLLYGVPELPAKTPETFRDNAFADNVGLAMLRSQTPGRPVREQIQATLHFGTHGWAHGHYDRTNLLSLMRYGRSFYNPEMVWYSYEPFMYKFYVQNSTSKNMVVVDQKKQEAAPGERLLFHTGKAMQATAVETTARWSNPPYGGMVYDYVPVKTFAEKTWREGRFVPVPENPPAYGTLTDFSEPVLQRRVMVVTDDYVVLADFARGGGPHTFENLFQMKGFEGIEAVNGKTFLRHDAQWNPDPVKDAQFVTDCDWYRVQAPAVARFHMRFGPGADNAGTRALYSEDGSLRLDVHSLWPATQDIMVGTVPEDHGNQKRLFYTVRGDGKTLAEGKFGSWILGQGNVDVPLDGVKSLELETRTELATKPTLFWANARVITRDGRELPLSGLPVRAENVVEAPSPGRDYAGGPVKIVGTGYREAVAAEPKDAKQPGFLRVDLSGVDAVRFVGVIGGDYPSGNEDQRRKTLAVRAERASDARFLTVIEPYEDRPRVKSAVALGPEKICVELADGRTQEITLERLDGSGKDLIVRLRETRDGAVVREESTAAAVLP